MKHFLCYLLLFAFSAGVCTGLRAQKISNAMELVTKNAMALSLSESDLKNCTVSDAYVDRISKAELVYLQQTYLGLPVLNLIKTIASRNS